MITLTIPGQSRSVSFPVPWSNVTLGQYARMQGKHPLQQAAVLAGVEDSDIEAMSASDKALLCLAMDQMGEVPQEPLTGFPANIGLESIGKFELAKKFVEQFQDVDNEEVLLWDVAPYILAIYLWASEEDVKRGFYAGFPVPLVDKAKAMPITQAIGAVVFFSANCPGLRQLLRPFSTVSLMPMNWQPVLTGSRNTAFSAAL